MIGNALQKIFANGKVTREQLFITTKLTNTDHRPERVEKAIQDSLRKLQIEYLDLYLMHWPYAYVPQDDSINPELEDGKPKKNTLTFS